MIGGRSVGARPAVATASGPFRRWTNGGAAALVAVALFQYWWASDRLPIEPYYATAARSMALNPHNFFFAAFDPAGTISLDKLPAAVWLQALSVEAFGFSTGSIILPQILLGAASVWVIYRAVGRSAGGPTGLAAAAVLAFAPAFTALSRGNTPDSLMVFLLLLAADSTSRYATTGRARWAVTAGVWIGLAFQAKMLAAWVLGASVLIALLAVRTPGRRRTAGLTAVAAVTALLVSTSWIMAVSLVPRAERPAVDGSVGGSVAEQVFGYNGISRLGGRSPLQVLVDQGVPLDLEGAGPAWNRLLTGELGHHIGWLLPAALVASFVGIVGVTMRRGAADDALASAWVLWSTWLWLGTVAFSVVSTIQPYYVAALAPAVAALVALAGSAAWTHRDRPWVRVAAAATVAGTAVYSWWLLPASGTGLPTWLAAATVVVGVAATVELLTSVRRCDDDRRARVVATVSALAALLVPVTASIGLAAERQGVYDVAFQPRRTSAEVDALFLGVPQVVRAALPGLREAQGGAPVMVAVQSAAIGSVFGLDGDTVLPLGGFTGTTTVPTVEDLARDVRAGRVPTVLAFPASPDARIRWVAGHCRASGTVADFLTRYDCRGVRARE